jgi:transposase-like protein
MDTAKNFFAYSGEAERKGSQERTRRQVECVIAFTSREVAEGGGLSGCRSKWLNLDFKSGESLENVFGKFLTNFSIISKKSFEFRSKEFEFYIVEIKHTNFEDCLRR